jgi:hypothetical protein
VSGTQIRGGRKQIQKMKEERKGGGKKTGRKGLTNEGSKERWLRDQEVV